jgi:hypothetical protein
MERSGLAVRVEYAVTGEHLYEKHTQAEQIRAAVQRLLQHLLRAQIPERALQRARPRAVPARHAGDREPEVEQLGDSAGRDHHVRSAHVAVNDPERLPVGICERVRVLKSVGD